MSFKLLTEHNLEFLSLKGDCTCSSESTLIKMPHCWKSHAVAHFIIQYGAICVRHRLLIANVNYKNLEICTSISMSNDQNPMNF